MAEPNILGGPCRERIDDVKPLAANLVETRTKIDACDEAIVPVLFERYKWVVDAVRFKADADEVQAPARQAAVVAHAVEIAKMVAPDDERFQEFVGKLYGLLVPVFVDVQAEMFNLTRPIDP